jgi:hypothetical protein
MNIRALPLMTTVRLSLFLVLLMTLVSCSSDPNESGQMDAGTTEDSASTDVQSNDTAADSTLNGDTSQSDASQSDASQSDASQSDASQSDASQSDAGVACPLTPNQCVVDDDCTENGAFCAPAGTEAGCGICIDEPDMCANDTVCKTQGDHFICAPAKCSCGNPGNNGARCIAGCLSAADCALGTTCHVVGARTGRCTPTECTIDADCPANFGCSESACVRLACTESSSCDGCCVTGRCYSEPGACLLPSA